MKEIHEDEIKKSFSSQWDYFKEGDRTWDQTPGERKKRILTEIGLPEKAIRGKRVVDIGCGNGSVSHCFAEMGAKVTGIDISDSVFTNKKRYPKVTFRQMSILKSTLRQEFDIGYSSGVLHHTGDTEQAFAKAADAVKKGGILYVWLYSKSTGFKKFLLYKVKPLTKPLPLPLKRIVFVPIALMRMAREKKNFSEAMVNTFDFFSCPYRDEYGEEEVLAWFKNHGFKDVKVTDRVAEGFGIRGIKQ